MKVVFAIGEKKEERENGTTMAVCIQQLEQVEPTATAEPTPFDYVAPRA